MIMYNTTIGIAAGAALVLVPRYWATVREQRLPLQMVRGSDAAGWASAFGTLGALLTLLGGAMTLTHPLAEAKPYIDTVFGEPSLILGVALLAAGWRLSRPDAPLLDEIALRRSLAPTAWIIALLGVVLAWCTAAILRFDVISSAPVQEPITGLLNALPVLENTFFALLYGTAALGCLIFPAAIRAGSRLAWPLLYWSWTFAGIGFALFSAMNFYTHTGMIINFGSDGPDFRW